MLHFPVRITIILHHVLSLSLLYLMLIGFYLHYAVTFGLISRSHKSPIHYHLQWLKIHWVLYYWKISFFCLSHCDLLGHRWSLLTNQGSIIISAKEFLHWDFNYFRIFIWFRSLIAVCLRYYFKFPGIRSSYFLHVKVVVSSL